MSRDDKIIAKMKRSPRNVRFSDAERLLVRRGFVPGGGGGSHVTFRHPDGRRVTIARPHGGDKTIHPEAVRAILDTLGL